MLNFLFKSKSKKLKLQKEWNERVAKIAEADKLRAECAKLWAEGRKLHAKAYKLYVGDKLWAEGDKLWAEGDKLWAEGNKLFDEANAAFIEAVISAYGNVEIKKSPKGWTIGDDFYPVEGA